MPREEQIIQKDQKNNEKEDGHVEKPSKVSAERTAKKRGKKATKAAEATREKRQLAVKERPAAATEDRPRKDDQEGRRCHSMAFERTEENEAADVEKEGKGERGG